MDWDRITRSGARAPGAELNPTPRWCAKRSSARHRAGLPSQTTRCTKGRGKPGVRRRTPGAGLSDGRNGKALSDMPAFQPYWGKPAVRNDRGDGGNVGIIRSPLRATVLPDFAIVYDAKANKLYGLNSSGWAPKSLTIDYLHKQGLKEMPQKGINAVTVPGTVEGWQKLADRFGRKKLSEDLAAAIATARGGFPVPELTSA